MTPNERAEMIRLCDVMIAEHDLKKILDVVQQLNALLDRALIRSAGGPVVRGDGGNKIHQPPESVLESES